MLWLLSSACLAGGIVIGLLLGARLGPASRRVRDLEDQIQELRGKQRQYQGHVNDYFCGSAALMQDMADSYRDVCRHLAKGAQELCPPEIAGKLLPSVGERNLELTEMKSPDSYLGPPKDYVTVGQPDSSGTLAQEQDYGSRHRGDFAAPRRAVQGEEEPGGATMNPRMNPRESGQGPFGLNAGSATAAATNPAAAVPFGVDARAPGAMETAGTAPHVSESPVSPASHPGGTGAAKTTMPPTPGRREGYASAAAGTAAAAAGLPPDPEPSAAQSGSADTAGMDAATPDSPVSGRAGPPEGNPVSAGAEAAAAGFPPEPEPAAKPGSAGTADTGTAGTDTAGMDAATPDSPVSGRAGAPEGNPGSAGAEAAEPGFPQEPEPPATNPGTTAAVGLTAPWAPPETPPAAVDPGGATATGSTAPWAPPEAPPSAANPGDGTAASAAPSAPPEDSPPATAPAATAAEGADSEIPESSGSAGSQDSDPAAAPARAAAADATAPTSPAAAKPADDEPWPRPGRIFIDDTAA